MNGNTAKTSSDFSILDLYVRDYDPGVSLSFYRDLNLDQIVDKLAARWGAEVRKFHRYLPGSAAETAYRRAVYGDIKKEAVFNALSAFIEAMSEVAGLRRKKEEVMITKQQAVWQIREAERYFRAYEELDAALEDANLSSEGLLAFRKLLKGILGSDDYRQLKEQTLALLDEISQLRFIVTYDKGRISVAPGGIPGDGAYFVMLSEEGGRKIQKLQNPFISDPTLTEFEDACLDMIAKKKTGFFRKIEAAAACFEALRLPVLKRFENDILFYISYFTLQKDMEEAGFVFSTPQDAADGRMEAHALYDLALALSANADKKIVSNDFYFDSGERFFVLTGPNQGGKTTFARSLGQLVYFSRMGLDVPAQSASLPFFPDIQTHFSVEESVETGRGKLKEELIRLAPMMEENKKGSFVIINELFTTAASYDANIMGRKVLKHFTELNCMGIYVTHLKELAGECDGIVSLRAMLDDNRIQTFKIRRGEAEDIPCAENVVNKYRLTYEQLKERL